MKKSVFLFPGQGAQYVGMGQNLLDEYPKAAILFEEANDVLGFDIKKLCLEGDIQELTQTQNTQPAILLVSYIAFQAFMDKYGILPNYAAGHSLGEITALTAAGAINLSDALNIVRQRGLFMQEAAAKGAGKMAAIGNVEREEVEALCRQLSSRKEVIVVSNYNSPNQVVVSGAPKLIEELKDLVPATASFIPLKVSAPFHSPYMEPAAEKLKTELSKYEFGAFQFPVFSNVTAKPYNDPKSIQYLLGEQMVKAVQWDNTMQYLMNDRVKHAVEFGPKTILKNLMAVKYPACTVFSSDVSADMTKLDETIIGFQDENRRNIFSMCLAAAVCTQNKNFNDEEYQSGVVVPYKEIKAMQARYEGKSEVPSNDEIRSAINLLETILETKKVTEKEREERIDKIIKSTGVEEILEEVLVTRAAA